MNTRMLSGYMLFLMAMMCCATVCAEWINVTGNGRGKAVWRRVVKA
ncbi:MAG: hypothetical protein NTU53_23535 [Planctomycetota bacterium]|nr:hypothetical protein [Planctomycetota bacterium]